MKRALRRRRSRPRGRAAEEDWKAAFRSLGFDPEELWMRYDGLGFGADECHAGYAFLK